MVVVCVGVVGAASGGTAEAGAPPDRDQAAQRRERAAVRDSLRAEWRRYAKIAAALRDSVSRLEGAGEAATAREQEIEKTITELTRSLSELSTEISELDVQVFDNAIRLRDRRGGSLSIQFPDDLDKNVARGLGHLSRVILDELPDTLRVELPKQLDRATLPSPPPEPGERATPAAPPVPEVHRRSTAPSGVAPPAVWSRMFGLDALRKKRVIEGDVVKVRDDVVVQPHEIVRGNVVAVMGDALIEGQVDGNVVVVLGDLQLAEGASVGGRVVTVLGRLDRDDEAGVGAVTVVNPGSLFDLDLRDLASGRGTWLTFAAAQVLFLLAVLIIVILMATLPAVRLQSAAATLVRRPLESLGLGLLMATAGHLLLAAVLGVLVITVIGIPVALLAVLGVILLDLIAVGIVCLEVGRWLCARFSFACHRHWAITVLGMAVIHVPSFLATLLAWQGGVPGVASVLFVIGLGLKVLVYVLGLGALVASRLGTREPSRVPDGLTPLPMP